MTCHRDGARHCSCAPETVDAAALAALVAGLPAPALVGAPHLVLSSPDPRAHAALRALVSPLEAEVVPVEPGVSRVTGDVAALLVAAAAALPVVGLPVMAPGLGAPNLRPEPAASLPRRSELLASLERELAQQRPGTTTALLFCSTGSEAPPGSAVLAVAASRVRTQLRRSDLLAHCGAGRFVALLPALPLPAGEDAAARVVAAVRDALLEPVATAEGLFPLRPVVGVLVHPGAPADGEPADAAEPLTAAEMLAVVERAMERGSLPTT